MPQINLCSRICNLARQKRSWQLNVSKHRSCPQHSEVQDFTSTTNTDKDRKSTDSLHNRDYIKTYIKLGLEIDQLSSFHSRRFRTRDKSSRPHRTDSLYWQNKSHFNNIHSYLHSRLFKGPVHYQWSQVKLQRSAAKNDNSKQDKSNLDLMQVIMARYPHNYGCKHKAKLERSKGSRVKTQWNYHKQAGTKNSGRRTRTRTTKRPTPSCSRTKLDSCSRKGKNKPHINRYKVCLLYTSPSPRDRQKSRMPSSA